MSALKDQFMGEDEYRVETIRLALKGDASAGQEALDLCRAGLDANNLHADLRVYLAERISEVLDGVSPAKALRIAKKRGRPMDPFPDWQQHLGALAALLTQRGYKPQQIAVAMCDQRATIHNLPMEPSDAHAIRVAWAPMQQIGSEMLLHLAGPYGKVFHEYPPLKKNALSSTLAQTQPESSRTKG